MLDDKSIELGEVQRIKGYLYSSALEFDNLIMPVVISNIILKALSQKRFTHLIFLNVLIHQEGLAT